MDWKGLYVQIGIENSLHPSFHLLLSKVLQSGWEKS